MIDKVIKVLKKPEYIFFLLSDLGFLKKMDDAKYLKIIYRIRTGHSLDLNSPPRHMTKNCSGASCMTVVRNIR